MQCNRGSSTLKANTATATSRQPLNLARPVPMHRSVQLPPEPWLMILCSQALVAGATSRPLILCLLSAPHRTYTTALRTRQLSPTPQLSCLCGIMSCQCHISVMSHQHHVSAMPHALQALSNSGPVKLRNSAVPEGSLRFRPLLRPSSAFSMFLCLRITWTILRLFPCINSGPPMLPVPHLSLFWL
jgi:hypothetical protein